MRWRAAPLGWLVANDCYSFVRHCGMVNPNVVSTCTPKEGGVFGAVLTNNLECIKFAFCHLNFWEQFGHELNYLLVGGVIRGDFDVCFHGLVVGL